MTSADTPPSRLLPLVGAFNFRDLGGYPTDDGRRTRWGRVFRSDTLQELSAEDLETLRQLGLRTVVDLRTATEVERDGRGPLQDEPIHYVNLSVLPEEGGESVAAPAPDTDDVAARYLWYLDTGRDALTTAIEMVADDSMHPLVFHCMAGKDRTGVLSALLLSCVGVVRETIVDDYAQTAATLHLIIDRLRRHPVYGKNMPDDPPPRFGVDAGTMERFLELLDEHHGGAMAWAKSAGVSAAALANLPNVLLEGEA